MDVRQDTTIDEVIATIEEVVRKVVREEIETANRKRLTRHHRIEEACKILRLSRSTIDRMRSRGEIKFVKTGNVVIIPDDEIQRLLLRANL